MNSASIITALPLAEIMWEHSAPKWFFVFMALIAFGVMVFTAIKYMPRNLLTPVLALFRIVFFILLGWCLMLPLRKEASSELVKPRFVVALDTSASMSMSPTSSIPTRWAVAQEVLKMPWKQMIAAQCDIDVYPFAESLGEKREIAKTDSLKPDGQSTRLHSALAAAMERYQGQPLAGLLLLSDGLDTRETTDEWVGMKWPCPVYSVRLEPDGIWEREVDVAVESVETPARVIVGWNSKLTAVVAGQGTKGETLHVQLFRNGELLKDEPTKIPTEGGSREVTFQLENKDQGSYTYTVSVPVLKGETVTNNNSYSVSAQVVDAKNRVLYIEDVPRWESKYLTRVLRENPAYTPLVFLRGPEGKFLTFGNRGDTTLHFTDEQLAQFKMVVLGDLDVPILTEARAAQMVKYVENGGSLILLGGAKSWGDNGWQTGPMAKMLPIKKAAGGGPPIEGRYPVTLTEEGRAHPVFQTKDGSLNELPQVLSLFPGAKETPGATVLANAQGPDGKTPLIVLQRYGQGKVVVLMTDSLWRWQLEPGKDKTYGLFWNQLLAWLAPQEDKSGPFNLDLYASEDRVFLGDSMTLNARIGSLAAASPQAEVKVEVEEPGGRKVPFTMQRRTIPTSTGQPVLGYGTDFEPKVPGLYKAVAKATLDGKPVESQPYSFFVKPFTPETNPKPARADLLQAIARTSMGRFCEKKEIDQVLSALTFKSEQTERVIYNSLWNNPWILGLLVLLLSVEWMVRRMRNMA
jgi:hypothetical protein